MTDVFRQLRSAVFPVQEHLHQRKSVSTIKRAARRIKKPGTLAKKFLQRQRLLRVAECLDQRTTITPRRKSERAVNQPIGWLNQQCARSDVRLIAINHFEQNRAEQFPFDSKTSMFLEIVRSSCSLMPKPV